MPCDRWMLRETTRQANVHLEKKKGVVTHDGEKVFVLWSLHTSCEYASQANSLH